MSRIHVQGELTYLCAQAGFAIQKGQIKSENLSGSSGQLHCKSSMFIMCVHLCECGL